MLVVIAPLAPGSTTPTATPRLTSGYWSNWGWTIAATCCEGKACLRRLDYHRCSRRESPTRSSPIFLTHRGSSFLTHRGSSRFSLTLRLPPRQRVPTKHLGCVRMERCPIERMIYGYARVSTAGQG